jgi:hypothetical protein
LEDLTDGAARSRSIEEPGNDISGRQVWTELAHGIGMLAFRACEWLSMPE